MRLLETSTLALRKFADGEIPPYAILSHRWGDEEVTFQDVESGRGVGMAGYAKIRECCAQAKRDGFKYAWIDSCCINKESAPELSESINSMFRWYEAAQVCYAYLADVDHGDGRRLAELNRMLEDGINCEKHLAKEPFYQSKWFTRGWTLQELLAPGSVLFFNHRWVDIGSKLSLRKLLQVRTGIQSFTDYKKQCIAQKLSWAAGRETTKLEDRAYSILGIMGVNMPLLYGEGEQAFIRLQKEIMNSSDDESIFAWFGESGWLSQTGLLATSPDHFKRSGDIYLEEEPHLNFSRPPYSFTNKGLQIRAELYQVRRQTTEVVWPDKSDDRSYYEFLVPLNCRSSRNRSKPHVVLRLVDPVRMDPVSAEKYRRYYRMSCETLEYDLADNVEQIKPHKKVIYVPQRTSGPKISQDSRLECLIRYHALFKEGFRLTDTRCVDETNSSTVLSPDVSDQIGKFPFSLDVSSLGMMVPVRIMIRFSNENKFFDLVLMPPSSISTTELPRFELITFAEGHQPRPPAEFQPRSYIESTGPNEFVVCTRPGSLWSKYHGYPQDLFYPKVNYPQSSNSFWDQWYSLYWLWKELQIADRARLQLSSQTDVVAALKREIVNGKLTNVFELSFER